MVVQLGNRALKRGLWVLEGLHYLLEEPVGVHKHLNRNPSVQCPFIYSV